VPTARQHTDLESGPSKTTLLEACEDFGRGLVFHKTVQTDQRNLRERLPASTIAQNPFQKCQTACIFDTWHARSLRTRNGEKEYRAFPNPTRYRTSSRVHRSMRCEEFHGGFPRLTSAHAIGTATCCAFPRVSVTKPGQYRTGRKPAYRQ